MKLSTKNIAAILFLLSTVSFSQGFNSDHFMIEKIGDGIYAAIHKNGGYAICNSGIIDLGDAVLVFDSFISPEAAGDLKRAAEQLTSKPVKYVINSHYHNDHVRGNQVFENALIISTEKTRRLIEKNEPEELEYEKSIIDKRIEETSRKLKEGGDSDREENLMWSGYYKAIKASFEDYKITLPNFTIDDSLTIYGTERKAVLFTEGQGHTGSDLVLWLPDDKVLFAGDLLFVKRHPWLGDGSVSDWSNYLIDLSKLNAEVIVPGHGPITDNKGIVSMSSYIQSVNKIVDDAIINKTPEDELKQTPVPEEFKDWLFGNFFIPNIINLYELKNKNQ